MKKLALIALLTPALTGCFITTSIEGQGDGRVTSVGGHDCSKSNPTICTKEYTGPGQETLTAEPDEDSVFTRWEGCNYQSIDTCQTLPWDQNAADNGIAGTQEAQVAATFEKKRPDVQAVHYTYNALGQRITKTVDTQTTIFQYDLDGNLIAEIDAATGQPVRQHIHVNGEPMAQLSTATDGTISVQYVHADHVGTPTLLTDQEGKVVADIEATPFGEAFIDYAEVTHNRRFPGQYKDEETGLHYNYFRDYDPSLGRYVQSDPIGLLGGLNTYGYVDQNPLIQVDPFGLQGTVYGYGGGPYSNYYTNRNNEMSRQEAADATSVLADTLTIATPFSGPIAPYVGTGAGLMTLLSMALNPEDNGASGVCSIAADQAGQFAGRKLQVPLKMADWGVHAVGGAFALPVALSNVSQRVSE